MDKEKLIQFYMTHRGGINGALTGFVISVLVLTIGLFRTLFIVIFVALGYFLGKKLTEDSDYIKNLLDKILPPGMYR
ncbi:hypothetical protein CDQ84_04780 [Clostridium thermosuccinogenes]|jgi:uncharacterized membrane protein|uniref:DUF2273 domain-containing protein n=1 Tax=Clostridium thermosuccinogenes TaxID=84032 RepID=A0A2K2FPN6_9CLOT|nr:DUF2273 domain-containing protein [Pseudoclostridium thermosuccinogenes]AUS96167.1 hypothetical protein CDO33_06790 [Pseudoclostridium thermosuccinogenes]PNT93150.1 hypothetical protein CDQ83_06355 [Pseudoclostridium thermosuccinogenes]PNT98747.1 hypothetical protein CDQ85_04735 [Pseudoclostridium thermosuccinogenes]PNU00746.1 hypothetical protein CDQ84_04780 [Pseudoclostridium thermosuccinogenes]